MKHILYILALIGVVSFNSCIENDIPLPIVKGEIIEFEAEDQSGCVIDLSTNTVTVEFYDDVDVSKVDVIFIAITKNAKAILANGELLKNGSVIDLTTPLSVTIITYQPYEWKIEAKIKSRREITVNAWARKAYLKAAVSGKESGFEWRKVGSDSWSKVVGNVDGEVYRGVIEGLEPNTEYEGRIAIEGTETTISQFTTEGEPVIENMSFEEGYYEGKNFYPNKSGGNSFWGTGNEGVTMVFAGGNPSNTVQIEDGYIGKGMSLTSIKVNVVGHAAGNLFTGGFKTEISNPKNSVKFGRPYTGRPARLKGWHKFKSTIITEGKREDLKGLPDEGNIWVSIENWGNSTTRPAGLKTGLDKKGVLGYGQLLISKDVDVYTEFTVNIEYNDTAIKDGVKPTHIVVVFTSSRYGEDYIGGLGTNLCVDELKFEF